MKPANSLFAVLATVLFVGCTAFQSVSYNVQLQSVERSDRAEKRYGAYALTQTNGEEEAQQAYEDGLLRATWVFDNTSMLLGVENKTPHSLWIRLDKGNFVMLGGQRSRLLRGDMSYRERDGQVPPLIVPGTDPIIESSASASVHVLPRRNVTVTNYSGSGRGYGTIKEILQPTGARSDSAEVRKNIGRRFSVTLPIETRDAIDNYTFIFEVTGATIPSREGKPQVIGDAPGEQK